MQLAVPQAIWWSLLAIPIIVFYILKIRLRRVPVSTVMFWNQIFDEKKPRSIWQRLRHLLSLLLQLAFLAFLVVALTDPFFSWEKLQAKRIVLVVDNSASMRATDVEPDRLAAAKVDGLKLIRGLRGRDQMAVISAGGTPRVEMGLTGHQRTLRETLDRITATDSPTQVHSAVQLARRLLADHENGEVVVLTDGCFPELAELRGVTNVRLVRCGAKTANVGITQFQVRRSLIDTIGYEILVEVRNFSDEPAERRLEVNLPSELVDVIPLNLQPGERWSQVLQHTSAAGGHLTATLDRDDALASDNRAVALLPPRRKQPVILVSQGSLFLQSALAAIPLVELSVTMDAPQNVPPGTIVVYHQRTPGVVPRGYSMFIQPDASTNAWNLGDAIGEPIVTKQDGDSTLMTHVQLENVILPEARELRFLTKHHVLAESLGGKPLYTAIEHDQGKSLVLTVELEKGDLPLRTAFPIMITNAIGWFQGEQGELRQAVTTGDLVACDLSRALPNSMPRWPASILAGVPAPGSGVDSGQAENMDDATSLVLVDPSGHGSPLPMGLAKFTIGPLQQCGVWRIQRQQEWNAEPDASRSEPAASSGAVPEPLFEVACNLSNAAESDIRVVADEQAQPLLAGILGGDPIWFYLVVCAFLLTVVEWFLYQRRWIN